MSKILGLDLGTNSIGWAVVDAEQKKILGTGVRIFPEGVENLGQGAKEKSKNASRRESRQTRRQYFRKRLRKIKLLEILIEHNMCPLTYDELKPWKHYDKSKGKAGRKFPATQAFNTWIKLNPYQLRSEGLKRDMSLHEFGRVLYHLIQRRGFWSNRKLKEGNKIEKGSEDKNIAGIKEAFDKVGEDKEYPTLGAFLYDISHEENAPYKRITDKEGKELRVRARYTLRKMYIDEFEKLWVQQAHQLGLNKKEETVRKTFHLGNPYKEGRKENGLKRRITRRIDYLKTKGIKTKLEIDENKSQNALLIVEKLVSLKELLGGGEVIKQEDSVLFYQRPLRTQKHLLDECTFERTLKDENGKVILKENGRPKYAGKKPCPISHPLAELRRAYEFINNVEYGDGQALNEQQKKMVLDVINSKDSNFKFSQIPKALKLEHEKFNYDDKHDVPGNYTHKHVKPLFSEEIWKNHYHEIWHCFHFYSDNDKLVEKLHKDFGLKEKDFDKVWGNLQEDGTRKNPIVLKDGYSNLSLKAIKNIIPFLRKGYKYSDAVLLGGVRNVFGNLWGYFENRQEEIEPAIIAINRDKVNKEGDAIEKIKAYLIKNEFGFEPNDDTFLGLYHHSQETDKKELSYKLGEVDNLRNPLVQQALYELKGLVNTLSREYLQKGERFFQIKVEMARNLKQSKKRRIEQWRNNQDREKENTEARAILDEYGLSHSRNNIHKYLLWKELRNETGSAVCPYTGKTISIADLFNDNQFQIEHIIPYSVSLDDSFANKTICDAEENGRKGERTPYQFYGSDEDQWEEIAERAFRVLPYHKAKRFTSKTAHETDFISRQLNDTRYISREAASYLKQICSDVRVFPGQLTADLRWKWGLDGILNPPIEVNSETEFGKFWAQMNGKGEPIAFYPIYNKRPQYEKGEFVITGEFEKGTFTSKYLAFTFEANGQPDGKYWAKIEVRDQPIKLIPILRDKPETGEHEILLYGKTDDKGKFSSKFLSQKLDHDLEKDTAYWAKLTVKADKTSFFNLREKKKLPKPKKNNVLLYGKVKDGTFASKIYSCYTNVKDGKYNTILEVDLENITFHKVKNEAPETTKKQTMVTGNVQYRRFQPSLSHKHFFETGNMKEGLYWAVFELKSEPYQFTIVENHQPKSENGELIEGTIALTEVFEIDKETGEVLKEEEKKYFYSSKGRSDHRHHAIDALVVALTEQSYLQRLSTYNANKKEKKRGKQYDKAKLEFPAPWEGFLRDAEKHINKILISYKKTDRVLSKKITKYRKTGKKTEGLGARGQLHKEFVFGKRTTPGKETAFHIRKSLTDIKNNKHINKIADEGIKKLILKHLKEKYPGIDLSKNFKVPVDAFFKTNENGIKQPRLFLPNKNGEPIPVKKVRIREKIGGAERLKEINQYVNPRNNHHVLIYKDKSGNLNETVVTFWTAVERKKQRQPIVQLPIDGSEIVCTLQINDTFLLGLDKDEINQDNQEILTKYLYRVQKISEGDYSFRHHLASTLDNSIDHIRIASFKKWEEYNPVKVRITHTGKIEPV